MACLGAGVHAGGAKPEQAHLRAPIDAVADAPWKSAVQASITDFAAQLPVNAMAQSRENKGDKGDKGDKTAKMDQPVSLQVPQNEMDDFMKSLSSGCSTRFSQMLKGKGGDLHTFGSNGNQEDDASCQKLDGALCHSQAHIIHSRTQGAHGRTLESTTDVSGNSCLPKQCMSQSDLDQLSSFMHKQAKNVIPGEEHRVVLKVDCSASGGPKAAVGAKSGSTAVAPGIFAMVLALGAVVRV